MEWTPASHTEPWQPASPDALPRPLPRDPAYLVFTSGSTGTPNAVVVSHGAFAAMTAAHGEVLFGDVAAGCRRFSLNNPASADAVYADLAALAHGRTLVVARPRVRRNPEALAEWITVADVEVLDATPTQITALVTAGHVAALERLSVLILGGEAVPAALWSRLRELRGTRVLNLYGPSECTVDVTWAELSACGDEPVIGRPLPGNTVRILGPDLRETPAGTTGQIAVSGPQLADAYLGNEALTNERFVRVEGERTYLTGDSGHVDSDGVIHCVGRLDGQVQIDGFRVELGEVEAAVGRAPYVNQCCAFAVTEPDGSTTLHAAVVLDPAADAVGSPATITRELADTLARHMRPRLHVRASLPLAATGKTDARAVRDEILAERERAAEGSSDSAGPSPETVRDAVARFWRELLGVDSVAPDDDFFAIGGNSLRAVKFVLRVRRELGVEMAMTQFFGAPTLRRCSERIDALREAAGSDG